MYGYYGYGPYSWPGYGWGGGWGRGWRGGWGGGWGRGWRGGWGGGWGWGARLGYCPWTGMPRGWRWWGYYGPGPYGPTYTSPWGMDEKEALEREKEALERELKALKDRLEELKKEK